MTAAKESISRAGFKVLTSDYRPPVQGGDPVWDGVTLPHILKASRLDTSNAECAAGVNFTADLPTALRIAGLWPNGRPSVCLHVSPSEDAIVRGDKRRCSELTITGRVRRVEVVRAIRQLSEPFGKHAARMSRSQVAWYDALGRPGHDRVLVEQGLRAALAGRGLEWELREYESARDAWDARAAWAAWDAWDARAARAAWDARDARAAWAAWDAWDARAARAAWDARAALTVEYAALQKWTKDDPLLLTTGLRDAYAAGLGIAAPVAQNVLGWAMDERHSRDRRSPGP